MRPPAPYVFLPLLLAALACNLFSPDAGPERAPATLSQPIALSTATIPFLPTTPGLPTALPPSTTASPSTLTPLPATQTHTPLPTVPPWPALETRPDGAQRLTAPPSAASDQNPAFSPVGARLLFTRFDSGYNDGPAALFLLDLATGQVARLTPAEDQDNVNLPGSAWNPANNRIVFASDRMEADDLWRIAPDGSDFSRITHHDGIPWYIEPSWSPDGQWIVFEASQEGESEDGSVGKIWKVRTDGSGLTPLTSDPAFDDRQPNWSPTGDRILYQRRELPDGQWDIYTIDLQSSDLRNLTANPASDTDASWSPDGQWIVVSSDYGGLPVPNIFIYPLRGGAPLRLTTMATHEDGAPSWSPDGNWIAFESHPGQDEDTPAALWIIRAPLVIHP